MQCGSKGLPSGSAVKNLPAMPEPQETWVQALVWEDPRRRAQDFYLRGETGAEDKFLTFYFQ